jgi:uncharacterized delta-60 repeat protein
MDARPFAINGTIWLWLLLPMLSPQLTIAQLAPGYLDATFAGTGKSRVGFGGLPAYGEGAAVQSDGKLVVAGGNSFGQFLVMRFGTNGVLDSSFGAGGKVVTSVGPLNAAAGHVVAIQTDGKIVAGGYAQVSGNEIDFALVRYNPDGSLDASFGASGKVFTAGPGETGSLTIQADSKIVAAGSSIVTGVGILGRYNSDGTPDASFGSSGIVYSSGSGSTSISKAILQSDGKIVAVGSYNSSIGVFRYTTNGMPDVTFGGSNGEVSTFVGFAVARSVAIQPGNNTILNPDKIVAAGDNGAFYFLARYNLDGSLDTSFGAGGIVTNTFGSGGSIATVLLVQGQLSQPRKITVAGYVGDGPGGPLNNFALARYTASGSPDTTFGGGTGKVLLQVGPGFDDEAHAITLQSGKIVLAGSSGSSSFADVAAARFNSDGSPDTAFGNNGVAVADADQAAHAQAVAIQPDGKMVIAGGTGAFGQGTNNLFALARLNPDGSLDDTFGSNSGKVTTVVGVSNTVANAIALQPDGRIVAAGYSFNGANKDFAIVRYNTDGSLDASFGNGGQVTSPIGAEEDVANAVSVQPDRKLVVAGYSYNGAQNVFAIARYTTNGTLDGSFGSSGTVATAIPGGNVAEGVQLQADGKLVVAGFAQVGSSADFALARYNRDGLLDASFGLSGTVTTDFGSGNSSHGYGLRLQPDGRIIVAGSVVSGGISYVALARYATNGVLDASFGGGGKVVIQAGRGAASLALQADGKIIAAGSSLIGSSHQYAILRFNPNGSLDPSYGIGGEFLVSFGEDGDDSASTIALDQIGRAVIIGSANGLFGIARLTSEPALKITSINPLTFGQVTLQGLGVPDASHTLYASPNLRPGGFGPLDSVLTDAGGFWQYRDTNTVGVNSRLYRLSYP